jgi:hypothetical protein
MSDEELEFEEDEKEGEELLLCCGEDGKLQKYAPKPGIEFNFETEEELKAFMVNLTETGLLKTGDKAYVKNVSKDFFEGFKDLAAAIEDSEDDDLSD